MPERFSHYKFVFAILFYIIEGIAAIRALHFDLSFQISFMKRCDTQEKRLQIPRPEWSAELECMIIACASIYDKCIDNKYNCQILV